MDSQIYFYMGLINIPNLTYFYPCIPYNKIFLSKYLAAFLWFILFMFFFFPITYETLIFNYIYKVSFRDLILFSNIGNFFSSFFSFPFKLHTYFMISKTYFYGYLIFIVLKK